MTEREEFVETYPWDECAERLADLLVCFHLVPSPNGKYFVSVEQIGEKPAIEFYLPPCFPLTEDTQDPEKFLGQIDEDLGEHLVVLVQAGAASLGWWSDDELIYHKVIKTYAVRGRGRAQTLYAKTKGKSRYGSRLRLRNAQQHLVDINEKILDWWDELGPAERIFYSCPQRTWPELFTSRPAPPFEQRDARLVKIPLHVHIPNFQELSRVHQELLRGRIIRRVVP